jgi:L-amino acid N-acyltransferase
MFHIFIRPAMVKDMAAIADITNHYIRTSTCTMKECAETAEERRQWFLDHDARYPTVVATVGGEVVGWAAITPFSDRSAYRLTVYDSVYVRHDLRGHGVGEAMLKALIAQARKLGYHSVVAVIGAEQDASLGLHHKLGFEDVAYYKQAGFKFDRWIDVRHLQLML